jgi:endonuclease/exonuclease/phosphatase family metal-dependent hydrolase
MIARKMKESMLEYKPINDIICKFRMKERCRNITVILVHAPMEGKEEREKEKFYECLEETYQKIQKYNLVIIMGDLNAKIGEKIIKKSGKKIFGTQH